MTEYRLVPNNWKIFSGSALKLIAIISMFIDHTACHLIDQKLVLLRLWGHELTLYRLMRDLGRLAFPIFCFLLIEGFLHTRFRLCACLFFGGIFSQPRSLSSWKYC